MLERLAEMNHTPALEPEPEPEFEPPFFFLLRAFLEFLLFLPEPPAGVAELAPESLLSG